MGSIRRRLAWSLLGAGCLAAAAAHLAAPVSPFDDGYIIYRYVENAVAGNGPVFNPGEKVFGVTCPLYAAWLYALKRVIPGADLPSLAVRGNLLFDLAAGLLAAALARRLGRGALSSALAGFLVCANPLVLRASLGGMESSLFLALCFGVCHAVAAGRDARAMWLAGLASLARPEGILLPAIVAGARCADRRTLRLEARIAAGLLPLGVWAGWATWYYGQPIPHSLIAKASGLYPLPPGTALADLLLWLGRLPAECLAAAGVPIPALAYRCAGAFFLIWILWRWWRLSDQGSRPRALALPAFLVLVTLFYAVSNPLTMPWYIPLVCAPALALAPAAGWTTGAPRRRFPPVGYALPLLVAASTLASFAYQLRPTDSSLFHHGATSAQAAARLAAYARTARWIEEHSVPSDTIAAPEIGVLGYRMNRRILDPCGLVSPAALPYLPVPLEQRGDQPGVISVEFVQGTNPDLVATLPVFARLSLQRSEWFAAAYEPVHEEPCLPDDARYSAVLVFRRRP